ncbi:hypothetical protein QTP70_004110 [Hemibagrus guttatus]|uniref:Uncharacterized protein n=1 Tax=Hemibagrus guttatus TaxID=175788 RepID=A0AAE0PQK0_9TELE|nr:hypothetical protein QTP70_004110 [Hemibagrus guttatus]
MLETCATSIMAKGLGCTLSRLAECICLSYGAGIVLRLGNIVRLEHNYCIPVEVQSRDRVKLCHELYLSKKVAIMRHKKLWECPHSAWFHSAK